MFIQSPAPQNARGRIQTRPSVRLLIFNILWADGPTSRSVGVVAEVQPDCYVMYDETLERRTLA